MIFLMNVSGNRQPTSLVIMQDSSIRDGQLELRDSIVVWINISMSLMRGANSIVTFEFFYRRRVHRISDFQNSKLRRRFHLFCWSVKHHSIPKLQTKLSTSKLSTFSQQSRLELVVI